MTSNETSGQRVREEAHDHYLVPLATAEDVRALQSWLSSI